MHKSHKKRKNRRNHRNFQQENSNELFNGDNLSEGHGVNNNEEEEEKANSILNDNKLLAMKESEIMGRYVVATKQLEAGTIIIREKPLVVGPCTDTPAVCLGCYYNFDKDTNLKPFKCPGCGWPLCSSKCPGIGRPYGHTSLECSTLATAEEGVGCWYAAITPLRCLLLQKTDDNAYKKLHRMASLNEIRCKRIENWIANQKYVVNRIRNSWKMFEYSEEQLHTICGILEVNAFEIGQRGISIRALYPTAFLLAHNCVPNTTHTDEENNYQLTIRTSITIPNQQLITLSYAYTLQSTLLRRQHLYESKFFWCQCERCTDPTELNSNAGTLLCPRCKGGHVLSTDPLNPDAQWNCTNTKKSCPGYSISATTVRLLMDKISDEIESIDSNDVSSFEEFLQRYRNVLHPNHFHCLGVKHSLSQLYGKITGYMIQELPKSLLERKLQICRDILPVFDILEPGLSRLRGVTLYELHAPLMILATRDFETKQNTKQELRVRLKEVVRCLKDSARILSFEPENSVEGIMACAAQDALHRMRDWEKILGKIFY